MARALTLAILAIVIAGCGPSAGHPIELTARLDAVEYALEAEKGNYYQVLLDDGKCYWLYEDAPTSTRASRRLEEGATYRWQVYSKFSGAYALPVEKVPAVKPEVKS